MDILHLVDRLEELFNESRSVPFTHSVIVDEDRMLDIIDQMRVSIPEEIKKAQQILAQRDRILARPRKKPTAPWPLPAKKASRWSSGMRLSRPPAAAPNRSSSRPALEIEKTKREADEYVLQTLTSLEGELDRILTQVRNGIRTLQSEKQTRHGRQNNH